MKPLRKTTALLLAALPGMVVLSAQDHLENQTSPLAGDPAALIAGARR